MSAVTGTQIRFADALGEALFLEMHRDPSIVALFPAGSPSGDRVRLAEIFEPERVVEIAPAGTPLLLAAAGLAADGIRPVCELGSAEADASTLEQLAELGAIHAANPGRCPVTVRLAVGDPLAGGPLADSDSGAPLLGITGLTVLEPATAADAKGLLTAALRADGPVCVIEQASLRERVEVVPEGAHSVKIGHARLAREGERLTVVAHGIAASIADECIARRGLAADLLDLRTLQPLDAAAVLTSVRKTGKLLIVEPGDGSRRLTAELVGAVWEDAFEALDAPPRRLRVPSPGTASRAAAAERIVAACDELLAY